MTAKPSLLVTRNLPDAVIERARRDYEARLNPEDKLYGPDEMIERAQGCDARGEVAMAKAWVSGADSRVCALGHQCHGAIGFTKEHNMQLYYRRAKAAELAFGDPDYHREQVAQLLGV